MLIFALFGLFLVKTFIIIIFWQFVPCLLGWLASPRSHFPIGITTKAQ